MYYFKIMTPFSWNQADGPMRVNIQAMATRTESEYTFSGAVRVSMSGAGRLITLYDAAKNPLPGFGTTTFFNGSWDGYVDIRKGADGIYMLGLSCIDPVSGVSGNSDPFQWIDTGTTLPPPIPPTIPPTPPPGGTAHAITLILDGHTYTGSVVG